MGTEPFSVSSLETAREHFLSLRCQAIGNPVLRDPHSSLWFSIIFVSLYHPTHLKMESLTIVLWKVEWRAYLPQSEKSLDVHKL